MTSRITSERSRRELGSAFAIIVSVIALPSDGAAHPCKTAKDILSEKGVAILSAACRVETFRVKPVKTVSSDPDVLSGYPIMSVGQEQGKDFAAKLAALLLEDGAYWDPPFPSSSFKPSFAFRVCKGDESVSCLVDFVHSKMMVEVVDAEGKSTHQAVQHLNPRFPKPLSPVVYKLTALWKASYRAKFLGDRSHSIVSDASEGESFRIKSDQNPTAKRAIDGYPIVQDGKKQGREFAQRLSTLLLDDRTYSFDFPKNCLFEPGVAFRIPIRDGSVETILCFSCDEFVLTVRDAAGEKVYSTFENFDPVRTEFVGLAKQAFPDDKAIQMLQEQR